MVSVPFARRSAVLQVQNNGPLEATGLVVSDVPPLGLSYVTSSASQGSYFSDSGAWNVGSVRPGLKATLSLTASVGTGTAGSTITNVAEIDAVEQFDSNSVDAALFTSQRVPTS